MRAIRSQDSKPEMTLRRFVHRLGYRYRLHRRDLPGRPDLVFPSRNKVIFLHGCFWHQHAAPSCRITRRPKSNLEYWLPKLRRNTERDAANLDALVQFGWDVLVVWECELTDQARLARVLRGFLDP